MTAISHSCLALFLLLSTNFISAESIDLSNSIQTDYAKWGRLAVQTAKQKFPDVQIVDYRYEGRTFKEDLAIEQFKLWAKNGDDEFGIIIKIELDKQTEKVKNIEVIRTER